MHEALHDEIDTIEELTGESSELTREIVKRAIIEHLEANADSEDILDTLRDALTLAAARVSEAHDELTTRAVRIGADAARKRYERSNG